MATPPSPISRGNYVVDVQKTGFQKTHVTDLSHDVNENKVVRVDLQVASVTSSVKVSASANIVQSEHDVTATAVHRKQPFRVDPSPPPNAARRRRSVACTSSMPLSGRLTDSPGRTRVTNYARTLGFRQRFD